MYNIENYTEGKMDQLSLSLFERKMKKDKNLRKKVKLYKDVDIIMQGALLAVAAEQEMMEKKIDIVAAGFVNDFYSGKEKPGNITELFNWS